MILVLGAESYLGKIFCSELRRRGKDLILLPARDYYDFDSLLNFILKGRPKFVINALGAAGKGGDCNEPACEEALRANTIQPRCVAQACLMTNTPWGHISSCAIYSGTKIVVSTGIVVEKRMAGTELIRMVQQCPEKLRGFTEADDPNFSFRAGPCNFFSGTMALAEEAIRGIGCNYIWRIGRPFNQRDEPENLLRQIQSGDKLRDGVTPLSHTDDFVRACLDLWERDAPYGTYNIANPGVVTTGQIVEMITRILKPSRHFEFGHDETDSCNRKGPPSQSDCILDISKLLATGVAMRPALEAIEDSLKQWRGEIIHGEPYNLAA